MCTAIAERVEFAGSGKGPKGWFELRQLYVGYDHPVHINLEHAVLLDFVDEDHDGARIAVELPRHAARELAERILTTLDAADTYETS